MIEQEQQGTLVAATVCIACAAVTDETFRIKCPQCGSLLENRYSPATEFPDGDCLTRFDALLPPYASELRRRLPPLPLTPCWNDAQLAESLGVAACYLKDETRNPTGTTKDRMAAVSLTSLVGLGVDAIAVSSTGNSSTSYAWAAQYFPEIQLRIFAGEEFVDRVREVRSSNVEVTTIAGDFVYASRAAMEIARSTPGLDWEGGFFNPHRRDGLKLTYLECYAQMPVLPTVVAQAVSSGMGIMAAGQATSEWSQAQRLGASVAPRYLCVQQSSCAPMATAWQAGRRTIGKSDIVERPSGIAKAILRGDPSGAYPYLSSLVESSGGGFASVTDPEIRSAQRLLHERGVPACPAGAAALAGVVQAAAAGRLLPDDVVLVNVTGMERAE
jgi:threonine synthase